jgi:hypothetical protein
MATTSARWALAVILAFALNSLGHIGQSHARRYCDVVSTKTTTKTLRLGGFNYITCSWHQCMKMRTSSWPGPDESPLVGLHCVGTGSPVGRG